METTCSTTRATGGGYTSTPEIVLSGGVQDYLIMYEGLTAEAPSLKPRTGTVSAARQHDLRYFDAVLPTPGAIRLVHSGSTSVHFQVQHATGCTRCAPATCTRNMHPQHAPASTCMHMHMVTYLCSMQWRSYEITELPPLSEHTMATSVLCARPGIIRGRRAATPLAAPSARRRRHKHIGRRQAERRAWPVHGGRLQRAHRHRARGGGCCFSFQGSAQAD